MIYIVSSVFAPNTAETNRMLGYYAHLDKLKIDATIVFVYPDACFSKITVEYKHLKIIYLWSDNKFYQNKYIRFIRTKWILYRFLKQLCEGDIIYTYGISPITRTFIQSKIRTKIKVFAEMTEHPTVCSGGRLTSLSSSQVIELAAKLDGLFVISQYLKKCFVEFGVREERIEVINMTVDLQRFIGLQKQNKNPRYIAYCGTVSNNKDGVDQLIKAFAILASRVPDVQLYIIGKTPSQNDESGNMALIKNLNISHRIVFTGMVSASDMPQLLKNADVLALNRPNSLQAKCGFPTKLGEYLLTENPVVVTNVGEIPHFLHDGESAFLSESDNPEEFASKLEQALIYSEQASEIGRKGAEVAKLCFNSEIETVKLVNFMLRDKIN